MAHSAKKTRQQKEKWAGPGQNLKKGGKQCRGFRNTLRTMGAVAARKSFLDKLKSQKW